MSISLEQFARLAVESGLLLKEEVQAGIKQLADGLQATAEQLAKELVKQKKLTVYQAQTLYQGKAKGLVLGNYVVLDKLGQGGMGMVLKAEHKRMKRIVALKVLSPAAVNSPDAVARFQREVQAVAKLNSPHIVTAFDADAVGGVNFLVMEYVEGSDLSSIVKNEGPLPVDKALDCILQAARGLEYAHQRGVVHRDIKPANLLLDRQGTVKVLDMGLARLANAADQAELTNSGQIMGTVDYMAPEQAMDTKHADSRADIYSLGVTLWYLLAGRAMYDGDTVVKRLLAHREREIPSLRLLRAEVPAEVEAVYARMVAKTPEARYQSMTEVIADLQACRGSGTVSAMSPGPQHGGDDRLQGFLNASGMGSGLQGNPRGATAVAQNTQASQAAAFEGTMRGQAQIDTDPHTQVSWAFPVIQPAPSTPARRAPQKTRGDDAWWQDRRVQIAAAAAGALVLALGIVVVVKNKRGEVIATVEAAEGSTVEIRPSDAANKKGNDLPPLLPGAGDDIDRQAAEWALNNGGSWVYVRTTTGEVREILRTADLPVEPFAVTSISAPAGAWQTSDVARLARLSELMNLDATSRANLDDRALALLKAAPRLRQLNAHGTSVTDAGAANFAQMSKLEYLNLNNCNLTDAAVDSLSACKSLQDLCLSNTKITATALAKLRQALPRCTIVGPDGKLVPAATSSAPGWDAWAAGASRANPSAAYETLASPDYVWSAPENLGSGVNGGTPDQSPSLTDDELTLAFSRQTKEGTSLWMSRRESRDQPFAAATKFPEPINGAFSSNHPTISGDGRLMAFSSDRPDSVGGEDIWLVSLFPGTTTPVGAPVNLGPGINTAGVERGPALSGDGLTLVLTQRRDERYASRWQFTRNSRDEPFGQAMNLGPHVNLAKKWNEGGNLSPDGLAIIYNVRLEMEVGRHEIWTSRRNSRSEQFGPGTKLPAAINDLNGIGDVALSADGQTLYFQAKMDLVNHDLWRMRRSKKP